MKASGRVRILAALFDVGLGLAAGKHEWAKHPPVLVSGVDDAEADPP